MNTGLTVALLGLFFTFTAYAQDNHMIKDCPGIGATGKFRAVYTDSTNQLSWSKKLPGKYSNGCVNAKGQYDSSKCTFEIGSDGRRYVKADDSNAATACKNICARLPTRSEFESLIRNFDHADETYSLRLTDKGRADMRAVFGDLGLWAWSSSVDPVRPDVADYFNGISVFDYGFRDSALYSVFCVVER